MADYLALNEFPGTGAIMQVAISFAGNRPDDNSGTTPYFDPADVKGEIITPATATTVEVVEPVVLTQVNATTFKTDRIVATGKVLRVSRHTMTSYPMVDFVDRQIVTENDLDVSSRQVLYAAMEALDQSSLAISYARQGLRFASTAVNTANSALDIAGAAANAAATAVATANAASGSAASAVSTANAASLKADQALANASSAEQHAENVETLAARADAASAQALTTASEAKSIASGIDAKATDALSKSDAATQTANAAKTTAEGIDAKATSAVQTANDAASKAASAKATAEGIEAKADSAQSTAGNAVTTANQANQAAASAKATAEAQAAAVAKAQADATAASDAARSANLNANDRVRKAGDTMTGKLITPEVNTGNYYLANNGYGVQNGPRIALPDGTVEFNGMDYLQMRSKSNGNMHIWMRGPNDADRGLIYNQADGAWIIRTAAQNYVKLANDGIFDVPHRAFGGGKEFIRRGQTYTADANNVVVFGSNNTNFGSDPGSEPLRISDGGNAAAAAVIAFLREGQFGAFFGIDNDNQWAVGGWSMGRRRFKLWHEGNFDAPNAVLKAELAQTWIDRIGWTGNIGCYAMCQTVDGAIRGPNETIGAGGLRWASHNGVMGSGPSSGTWRCCGYGNNGGVTLWQRIA